MASSITSDPPRLCVGMATFDDFDGVYFTIQSMRLSHPDVMAATTFLVLDNNPDGRDGETLRAFAGSVPSLRYVPFRGFASTAVRDLIFREADADVVLCVDPHVLVRPGALTALLNYFTAHPNSLDIVQGPLLDDTLHGAVGTHFAPIWSEGMYGRWAVDDRMDAADAQPFEIGMQGLGAFACRREAWPGLNPRFRGFGGEEGYLHEKFRARGGRAICLPSLAWAHRFHRPAGVSYELNWQDRIRNYRIGWNELGWGTDDVDAHFREHLGVSAANALIDVAERQTQNPLMMFDVIFRVAGEQTKPRGVVIEPAEPAEIAWRVERAAPVAGQDRDRTSLLTFRALVATAVARGYENFLMLEDQTTLGSPAIANLTPAIADLQTRSWDLLWLRGAAEPRSQATDDLSSALALPRDAIPTDALAVNASAFGQLLAELPAEDGSDMDAFCATHGTLGEYLRRRAADDAYRVFVTASQVVGDFTVKSATDKRPIPGTTVAASADEAAVVLFLRGFGVEISVSDSTELGIADRLATLMPPDLVGWGEKSGGPAYRVAAGESGTILLERDGSLAYTAHAVSEAVAWLRVEIDNAVALRSTEAMFMHAGVVGWRGQAIVIAGRSGTGKSSLVAELVREGALYYSDDYAPIDDAGRVHAYARAPSHRGTQHGPRRIGRPGGSQLRPALPIGLIVLTQFKPRTHWRPRVLGGARGVLGALDNVITTREHPARALATARAAAAGSLVLSGPRPEAGRVAPLLLSQLDDLLAGSGEADAQRSNGPRPAEPRRVRIVD